MKGCRALLVAAPASGQGKTTVTAALARRARQQGLRVRVFKTGPDFIDPMLLEVASGAPVHQLDLWMAGESQCRHLLWDAAAQVDLILIEGVMGLFDGDPSSADLAQTFGVPVLAVIDGSAMAQTFGAVAYGLCTYRESLRVYGVLANGVGSAHHARMLRDSLRRPLTFLGALPRDPAFQLPERHLGLLQAAEIPDLEVRIDAAAAALGEAVDFAAIPPVYFPKVSAPRSPPLLEGLHIGIARDAAFSFLYRANLDLLRSMGARLTFFSPLEDSPPQDVDALYLPGGYPELHAARLAANASMLAALRAHHAAGKPILAECGGMMPLFDFLTDREGHTHAMAGLLPGTITMQKRLQGLALQSADFGHGALRGHGFHYSTLDTPMTPALHATTQHDTRGESLYRAGALTASYVHFYLASNSRAAAALFGR